MPLIYQLRLGFLIHLASNFPSLAREEAYITALIDAVEQNDNRLPTSLYSEVDINQYYEAVESKTAIPQSFVMPDMSWFKEAI